jgi:hypothetical protein
MIIIKHILLRSQCTELRSQRSVVVYGCTNSIFKYETSLKRHETSHLSWQAPALQPVNVNMVPVNRFDPLDVFVATEIVSKVLYLSV